MPEIGRLLYFDDMGDGVSPGKAVVDDTVAPTIAVLCPPARGVEISSVTADNLDGDAVVDKDTVLQREGVVLMDDLLMNLRHGDGARRRAGTHVHDADNNEGIEDDYGRGKAVANDFFSHIQSY